jgi:class 3 adenylate cyclase
MTFFPIFDHIEKPRTVVGVVAAAVYWRDFMTNVLPEHAQPVFVLLENGCGQTFSFRVVGENVEVLGEDDLHERRFDHEEISFHVESIADDAKSLLTFSGVDLDVSYCPYSLRVFPTSEMEDFYTTNEPALYSLMMIATFVFASLVFVCYDIIVAVRQRKISERAQENMAVVNSLFPENVRGRMFRKEKEPQREMNVFWNQEPPAESQGSPPIADLFPNSTVMFADIAGFNAWSSSREPTQVFTLLETVYRKFDKLAHRLKVFKVETIGDCYVAVTGVPVAQDDHAAIMARFAFGCLDKMHQLMRELAVTLGPETADLTMRFGLHSGPVIAGVLRGEKSRFQLFGDTMNTASRMESTGVKNRIQCSEATAEYLVEAGKASWLAKREDAVHAKGKGVVETYWVNPGAGSTIEDSSSDPDSKDGAIIQKKKL